jgi:hypothetical protein
MMNSLSVRWARYTDVNTEHLNQGNMTFTLMSYCDLGTSDLN